MSIGQKVTLTPCSGCGGTTYCRCWGVAMPASTPTVGSVDERLVRADRRERIATACLASLLTHDGWEYFTPNHAAKDAIRYADALIEELDKEAKP